MIHSHVDWLPLPLLRRTGVPFLTTMHGRLDLPGLSDVVRSFPDAGFVSISDNQRQSLPQANWLGTILHGLPVDVFRPSYEPGSYLAFLGRLTAEKGPEDAIRIARAAGKPLRIAAKIPRAETAYFRKHLQPHIDGENVQLIGEVDDARKQPFLAGAAALLFPIDWPEPFGLVMIEAMACGTPVIAYRSGSVPEVVDDGVTGFIVDSDQDAVRAASELPRLDRRRVRARSSSASRRSGWRENTKVYTGSWSRLRGAPIASPICSRRQREGSADVGASNRNGPSEPSDEPFHGELLFAQCT